MFKLESTKRITNVIRNLTILSITTLIFSTQSYASDEMEIKPNDYRAAARLELATAYYSQKQYGPALQEVKAALKLYPDYLQAYNVLGLVETELGHFKEADSAFRNALRLDNTDGSTHNNYGLLLCQNDHVADAYTHFELAAKNPMYDTPEKALYNAGRCARTAKNDDKATKYFTEALKRQPRATAIMYEMAEMNFLKKNYTAVLDLVDRMNAIEGLNPKTIWLALRTEYSQNHTNEVESYGAQLVNKFPDSPETILYRARNFE